MQIPRRSFDRADEHGAEAAEAGGDGGLERLRRAEIRHARGDRARRHPVFDERDEQRVEDDGLIHVRKAAGQFEERHPAEIDFAEQFVR
jgi:hypothetical protein